MNIIIGTVSTHKKVDENEILSISIMNEEDKMLIDQIVKPIKSKMWPEASAVSGISPDDAEKAPFFIEIKDKVKEIIDKADTLIMYDVRNEIELLFYGGIKIGEGKKIIDVSQEFSKMIGEALPDVSGYTYFNLESAARYFGLNLFEIRSQERAIATKFVYDCMEKNPIYRVRKKDVTFYEALITSRNFNNKNEAKNYIKLYPENARNKWYIEKLPCENGYSYAL